MIQLIRNKDIANVPIKEYICDKISDVNELNKKDIPFGSMVLVLEDKSVRIKSSNGTWIVL